MTCEQVAKLVRDGAPDSERDAHVQACAPCRDELMQLQRAELCLENTLVPELSRPAEHRMWDAVQAAQRPERYWRWGALAAAVVLLLLLPRLLPQSAPELVRVAPAPVCNAEAPVEVSAPERFAFQTLSAQERMRIAGGRLEAKAGARLGFAWTETQPELTLLGGQVRLDAAQIDVNRAFVVETPLARFELIAAVVRVEVDDSSTTLHVEEGLVETLFQGESSALGAGHSRRFAAPEKPKKPNKPKKPVAVRRPPPSVKPAPEPETVEAPLQLDEEELERLIGVARGYLRLDPARSTQMLEGLLELALPPALEIEVLAVLADAARREGGKRRAVSLYERIAQHSMGAGYAEEALLRKARLLHEFEDQEGAIESLKSAAQRFEGGPLAPERRLLLARLYLSTGDPQEAAQLLLEEERSRRSQEKQALRILVAKALIERDPTLACRLVNAALKGPVSSEAPSALQLLRRCQNSFKKP